MIILYFQIICGIKKLLYFQILFIKMIPIINYLNCIFNNHKRKIKYKFILFNLYIYILYNFKYQNFFKIIILSTKLRGMIGSALKSINEA